MSSDALSRIQRLEKGEAISEVIGSVLLVFLVVLIAAIIASLFLGVWGDLFTEPVFASFNVDKTDGYGRYSHQFDVPVIVFYQMAGDDLTQDYTEHTHSGINNTKIKLIDPNGTLHIVNQSVTMLGYDINKGEPFYIFYYRNPDGDFWLTNDPDRILNPSWGGVEAFTPQGAWRVIITDELSTDMVLLDQEIQL
jgi:FlaG/FlaF family flagellin (archaellin)